MKHNVKNCQENSCSFFTSIFCNTSKMLNIIEFTKFEQQILTYIT